jgi:glycosyltransferase involved in cell wall biosynthesis
MVHAHMSLGISNSNIHALNESPIIGDRSIKNIALIHGRINYLTLGSVIKVAKNYVDRVYVLYDGYDRRIGYIARSSGVELISPPLNENFFDIDSLSGMDEANAMLVLLYGDGSHNPYKIPVLFEQLQDGYDIVMSSSIMDYRHIKENILLLNNKKPRSKFTGFMACKYGCFIQSVDRSVSDKVDISRQIYNFARNNDMRIKHLEDESFEIFNQFNIGVVVPAYNEERLLPDTISGIPDYVTRIYIIDDGSTDNTPEIIKTIKDLRVKSVRHETNKGVGASIITGYKMALQDEMDIVAVMAGDNQMDPVELPKLLMPIIEDRADYTKGNRLISREYMAGMSLWRTVGNSLLTMITKIGSGYWNIMDPQNGYTAISRQALETINLDSIYQYYGYCNDLLIKLNAFGMRTLDVVMPARYGSERSHIRYGKYILKVAPMIFRGFLWRLKTKYIVLSFHPLVFFYSASMIMVPFGVLFSLWILASKILHRPVSDNYPLLAVFITLMGVQLLLFAMLFDMQEDKGRSEFS